jgi:hypothetical protein
MAGTKSNDNTQWARVSSDGTRAVPLPDGDGIEPLATPDGVVWVRTAGSPIDPSVPLTRYDNGAAFAAQGTAVVSAVPATLIRVFGFKTGPNIEYVQLYDLAGGPPAGVPFAQFAVAQNADFSLDFGITGRPLATGLVVALSTAATAFAAAAATMWLNAELAP